MANQTLSKKGTFGTTMGVTSVIAILVILVLIVFSALSMTTSRADLKLAQKTADSTTAYYAADATAEEKLAEVSAEVRDSGDWRADLEAAGYTVTQTDGIMRVSYSVPIDENLSLFVTLRVSGDTVLREEWHVAATTEWNPGNSLPVIQ